MSDLVAWYLNQLDTHGLPVFLAANAYRMKVAEEDWPKIRFLKTREQVI